MQLDEYAKKCAEYIDTTYTLDGSTAYKVNFDGIKRTWSSIKRDVILDPTLLETTGCGVVKMFATNEKKSFSENVCRELQRILTARAQEKNRLLREQFETDIPMDDLEPANLMPVIDVETNNRILLDKETRKITTLDYDVWEGLLDKDELTAALDERRMARFVYDPYDISTLVLMPFHSFNVLKVNTYVPPEWRLRPCPEIVQCPPVIDRFLKHLIPDDKCREFAINWLHTALVGRNETYLVLNGSKGIGKGIFTKLAAMLVGMDNFNEAPVGLLNSQFNSALDKKRVISMDEFQVGKKEHTKLKRYINKLQTLEKKGVDADKLSETYNSYIIANNDIVDMHIETDDRRFSVLDLTKTDLVEIMSTEEITHFVNDIERDEEMAYQFGYYILQYGQSDDFSNFSAWKGPRFFELAYNSLYAWQKFLVDKILLGQHESISIKSAAKEYKKDNLGTGFPRNMGKIQDFFNNYKHKGTDSLGEVIQEKSAGEWEILIDDKYCPQYDSEPAYAEGDLDDLL